MRNMYRLLVAAAVVAVTSGLAVAAEPVKVAVTAIVEHPALDAARDGVRDGLKAAGWEGDEIEFTYESAQGNPATAAQIARKLVGEAPDVIVPISTPSAQAVVAATKSIPVVFTAVTDPVGAQLVTSAEKPGGNVSGLSDLSPLADHLALIREISPDAKTIGVPYNPGEPNAVTLVELLKEMAGDEGFTIVEATATKSSEVQAAAKSLVGKADVIYVPTDNTIVSALEAVISVGTQSKIPVYAGDTASVERGAIATVGFDYYQIGLQTAEIVARVLKGENPGDIPVTAARGTDLYVNLKSAAAMGVAIPDAVRERAKKVIE